MTILPDTLSLIVTLSVPAAQAAAAAKFAAEFRSTLGHVQVRVTWLTDAPEKLLATGAINARDEVGLLGPSENASRSDVAAAIRQASQELRAAKRELNTISEEAGLVWDHADLPAKAGCSAVLRTIPGQRSGGWLDAKAASRTGQPARGRFGLWIVPVTRRLATPRDVKQAARNLQGDLAHGLAHLAISAAAFEYIANGLPDLAASIAGVAGRNKLAMRTVQEVTQAQAASVRVQSAHSIFRKAA